MVCQSDAASENKTRPLLAYMFLCDKFYLESNKIFLKILFVISI